MSKSGFNLSSKFSPCGDQPEAISEISSNFENGEKKWVSGIDGEIRFVGDYHYSFFIVVTEIILVFINSLILAFPMSFFFASLGSIYYSMYNTDFKINVLKRIIGIVLLIMAINVGYSCLLDILNTLMI